ncbi:MAG TPA: OsmC family protein [Blastocatellia bacterium]|jgi:putative redox protein|nr:OsmC family protein [Blastocatellia bacterium]
MNSESGSETKVALLRYAGAEQFVGVAPSGHAIVTGFSHENLSAPTPMELLLISLGGCTGADVIGILEKKRQKVTGYEIEVRGERRAEHPRIYTSIEVVHRLRGRNLDPKSVAHAIELSETKYCSVSAMLASSAAITTRFEISEDTL